MSRSSPATSVSRGGFAPVWRESELFTAAARAPAGGRCSKLQFYDTCRGGCMAAKFFTGLPLDGPDPECALGHGEQLLAAARRDLDAQGEPGPLARHASRLTVTRVPDSACDESPLAGFDPSRMSSR